MATLGYLWPLILPAACAALGPYVVGIVVQVAFEKYARRFNSPIWPAIPVIFQLYRMHQLSRATKLITALSFVARGVEMTPDNLAIMAAANKLLDVLCNTLGIVSVWSLSSVVMRYFVSTSTLEQ